MPKTYDPIQSQTLASAQTSVTLSSIAGTFTDLVLVINGSFSAEDYVVYQMNGDTGSNYSETPVVGNGSNATSGAAANRAFIWTQLVAGSGVRFMVRSNFMNYANTTTNKTVLTRSDCASRDVAASVGLYRSTSAITSIRVYALLGNSFETGTTFTLYGIKAA